MVRIQVTLDDAEAEALAYLSASELREPREQARYILRQELSRRGLLEAQDVAGTSTLLYAVSVAHPLAMRRRSIEE